MFWKHKLDTIKTEADSWAKLEVVLNFLVRLVIHGNKSERISNVNLSKKKTLYNVKKGTSEFSQIIHNKRVSLSVGTL